MKLIQFVVRSANLSFRRPLWLIIPRANRYLDRPHLLRRSQRCEEYISSQQDLVLASKHLFDCWIWTPDFTMDILLCVRC
jgi:hypothetical protein